MVGELTRQEIGDSFHHTETDDEGRDQRRRREMELLRPDQWHDGALDSHHTADKGIDQNQQGELLPIGG
jgi:hypothetical protein